MLGEGIVSFGVAVVTVDFKNAKASAKIGRSSVTRSRTRSAAGVHSRSPCALWNVTFIFSSAWLTPPSW